ncbi:decarboxylating cobalt-precorrin-6B (C(15))-methyltransferase [Neisseria sp. Ec49-e6-T10]|uniref:decarboxylating cobalt-precorrin-6B (C(15))-methyltransferase n=1 Tax=Neisseria sp. Ec49-e6-T10 TaxID=3140744 RepID=UPI003EB989D8
MRDEAFIRGKVPMTKEEVRVLTIDRLNLANAKTLIDVGAGTGSICIEASMKYPQLQTIAIEKNPEAVELIKLNCEKFNVNNIRIIEAFAPIVPPVKEADAIFIGGSGGSLSEIIDWSYDLLIQGGRLALNFILLNNLMEALELLRAKGFTDLDVSQLQVSRLTALGKGDYFKPNNPTYIISCLKGSEL